MTTPQVKQTWQERVSEIDKFHKSKLRESNGKWRAGDTAFLLKRSLSSITQDLMLADWIRTYPKIEGFRSMGKALEFVRLRRKEIKMGD